MPFTLPELPYAQDALEPFISARTLEFHHGKHHKTYVDTLNRLLDGKPLSREPLEKVIQEAARDPEMVQVFNNAAQVWNHNFFWNCLTPGGGGGPNGEIALAIERDFGGYDEFAQEFKQAATTQFGSGWAWLVEEGGRLRVVKTANADLPLVHGQTALLTCDVWEHAYYLDYQNRRPDFVQAFLDKLVSWDFVNRNLQDRRESAAA